MTFPWFDKTRDSKIQEFMITVLIPQCTNDLEYILFNISCCRLFKLNFYLISNFNLIQLFYFLRSAIRASRLGGKGPKKGRTWAARDRELFFAPRVFSKRKKLFTKKKNSCNNGGRSWFHLKLTETNEAEKLENSQKISRPKHVCHLESLDVDALACGSSLLRPIVDERDETMDDRVR